MDRKLQQLQRLDEVEAQLGKSMEYHLTTTTTLHRVQDQMDQMMQMIQAFAATTMPPDTAETSAMNPTPVHASTQAGSTAALTTPTGSPTKRSVRSVRGIGDDNNSDAQSKHSTGTDSGSNTSLPPRSPDRKKHRSVHAAMEDLTLTHPDGASLLSTPVLHSTQIGSGPADNDASMTQPADGNSRTPQSLTPHMNFDDDESSLETATTDLDAQYTTQHNPDGGDTG